MGAHRWWRADARHVAAKRFDTRAHPACLVLVTLGGPRHSTCRTLVPDTLLAAPILVAPDVRLARLVVACHGQHNVLSRVCALRALRSVHLHPVGQRLFYVNDATLLNHSLFGLLPTLGGYWVHEILCRGGYQVAGGQRAIAQGRTQALVCYDPQTTKECANALRVRCTSRLLIACALPASPQKLCSAALPALDRGLAQVVFGLGRGGCGGSNRPAFAHPEQEDVYVTNVFRRGSSATSRGRRVLCCAACGRRCLLRANLLVKQPRLHLDCSLSSKGSLTREVCVDAQRTDQERHALLPPLLGGQAAEPDELVPGGCRPDNQGPRPRLGRWRLRSWGQVGGRRSEEWPSGRRGCSSSSSSSRTDWPSRLAV
mmetsp:Transcript_7618/g.24352  ORF Transcript_7618/g.24352 Transcript_7618/m.24352 type:complete len:371 (-) Transcript_7618:473-1585(-)